MTGPEIAMVALVATAASTALSTTQSIVQANNQAKMARYNAQVAEQNAAAAQRQADADAERQKRQLQRQFAKQRTGYAAAGVGLDGAPLDLLEDLAMEGQMDVLGIRQRGLADARQFSISASKSRAEASSAMTLGILGAGAQLAAGVSSSAGKYGSYLDAKQKAESALP